MRWCVANVEALLKQAHNEKNEKGMEAVTPWMKGWLGRLKLETQAGHDPPPGSGRVGYGDPTSCHVMERAIEWTRRSGSVRHGGECFNVRQCRVERETVPLYSIGQQFSFRSSMWQLHFPQDLDNEYLVTWDGFFGRRKWRYLTEPELRAFLLARIDDGVEAGAIER